MQTSYLFGLSDRRNRHARPQQHAPIAAATAACVSKGSPTTGCSCLTRAPSRHSKAAPGARCPTLKQICTPPAAPNIMFMLLDDTGFARFVCYRTDIDTPNVDALATPR